LSPEAAAARTRRMAVFSADLTDLLRSRACSLVRIRLICDLMLATPDCLRFVSGDVCVQLSTRVVQMLIVPVRSGLVHPDGAHTNGQISSPGREAPNPIDITWSTGQCTRVGPSIGVQGRNRPGDDRRLSGEMHMVGDQSRTPVFQHDGADSASGPAGDL